MRKVEIAVIERTGDCGMYVAKLNIIDGSASHFEAIEVIGTDLTECVERAGIVMKAFNGGEYD